MIKHRREKSNKQNKYRSNLNRSSEKFQKSDGLNNLKWVTIHLKCLQINGSKCLTLCGVFEFWIPQTKQNIYFIAQPIFGLSQ